MYGQTNAVPAYPMPNPATEEAPLVSATLTSIRSARQTTETQALRAMNLADRVFGPVPQGVSGGGTKVPEPGYAQAALEVELKELHNAVNWLADQLSRLERIA